MNCMILYEHIFFLKKINYNHSSFYWWIYLILLFLKQYYSIYSQTKIWFQFLDIYIQTQYTGLLNRVFGCDVRILNTYYLYKLLQYQNKLIN